MMCLTSVWGNCVFAGLHLKESPPSLTVYSVCHGVRGWGSSGLGAGTLKAPVACEEKPKGRPGYISECAFPELADKSAGIPHPPACSCGNRMCAFSCEKKSQGRTEKKSMHFCKGVVMEIKQKETKVRSSETWRRLHFKGEGSAPWPCTVLNFKLFLLFIQQTGSSCQNSE